MTTEYNGYANRATWNVALWITNDESLYLFAKETADYASFRDAMREVGSLETPDRVAYNDSSLDTDALDEVIYGIHVEENV